MTFREFVDELNKVCETKDESKIKAFCKDNGVKIASPDEESLRDTWGYMEFDGISLGRITKDVFGYGVDCKLHFSANEVRDKDLRTAAYTIHNDIVSYKIRSINTTITHYMDTIKRLKKEKAKLSKTFKTIEESD